MKFGLLTYEDRVTGRFNVGDHIQSLAAKQYLPRVDKLIERDHLNSASLESVTATIMNGWYTHRPENWPPVKELKPHFVSFHLNSSHADVLLSKAENVKYLKEYEPIGCRDSGTVRSLEKYGIKAYYSSCLTTTLDLKYKTEEKTNDILIVDLLYKNNYGQIYRDNPRRLLSDVVKGRFLKQQYNRKKLIKSIVPKKLLRDAEYLTHSYWNKDYSESERFDLAESLLKRYAKAKLVITSRIHCALPCLALGTPVVFITGGDLFKESEMSRLKGTVDHLNVISTETADFPSTVTNQINILDPQKIDWDNIQNPTSYINYANKLKESCQAFIESVK